MSLSLRYWGEFRSIYGTLYRIEILQEDHGTPFTAEPIGFAYDEAATIEWCDVDKLDPVQGSCLTLTLDSDSDRKFLDLYTIEVGTIRADVYRDGALYWSGLLDPELYEEPFSRKQDYDVSVSFSDFAVLDRKSWEGRGVYTIREVIDTCLAATGIRYTDVVRRISTKTSEAASGPLTLDEVRILGENLYDEDGEAKTLRETLEEVLRPFALRIVQKNGRIHVYDLNALYGEPARKVVWSDVDANLGADKVYNNVKVSFSPYAATALADGSLNYEDVFKALPGKKTTSVRVNTDRTETSPEGFTLEYIDRSGDSGDVELGNLIVRNEAAPCRIKAAYSGSDEAAVLWGCRPGDEWRNKPAKYVPFTDGDGGPKTSIIQTKRVFLPTVANADKWRLKVTLDALIDVRYNPFEPAARNNEEGNWDKLQNWCNYGYLPVGLFMIDKAGKYTHHYRNFESVSSRKFGETGSWQPTTLTYASGWHIGDAWLSFYDVESRERASGVGGWKTNRQTIGWYYGGLPSAMKKLSAGLFISLPPCSGFLEYHVAANFCLLDNDAGNREKNIGSRLRWIMYRNPKIEIVKENGLAVEQEDVEDTAWINKGAKEPFEIDTIFGTMPDAVPSARGLLLDADDNVYMTFSRGGHTDRLERLLIGTVYSQYATRKHVLSGTVELLPEFSVLTDASEPGQYVLLSEVQHLLRGESEIQMVQFDADNYGVLEYE